MCTLEINAQNKSHHLVIDGKDKDSFFILTKTPQQFENFFECSKALQDARQKLFSLGYLNNQMDSVIQNDTLTQIHFSLGNQYKWATLKNKNIPPSLLSQFRFNENKFFNTPIQLNKIHVLFEKIIRHFENNGYPFASMQLDSILIQGNQISALLFLDKGPLILIDTIYINEEAPISHSFVTQYLGIREKSYYNEAKILSIDNRIKELSFLQSAAPWRMDFTSTKNKLNLYLKSKSANRADVLIGLQPNTQETGGKFLLTGDVKLAFVNALSLGESLQLNWQNLQYKSPRYDVHATIPYILGSPIGISGLFDFYKKDTSFRTIHGELGAYYQFDADNKFKLYYQLSSSRLESVNISSLIATRKLPSNADITYKTLGSEILFQKLDYKLNPRKGYLFLLNGSVSFRKFIKNTTIENTLDPLSGTSFAYLYDTIQLHNYKYSVFGQAQSYTPLSKRLVLMAAYHGGITLSSKPLYRNELFQIGGYRLLRGFDEGSWFANQYHVFTIEPHYLISQNSYFFLFSDLAYLQSKFADSFIQDSPYSFGIGMAFETKSGIFNVSYGVGKSIYQNFELKNSKIHFGYINVF